MPAIIGSRPSDIVTSDDDEECMARMSDISNVTLGNNVAALSGAAQSGVKKSPFLQREVSPERNFQSTMPVKKK